MHASVADLSDEEYQHMVLLPQQTQQRRQALAKATHRLEDLGGTPTVLAIVVFVLVVCIAHTGVCVFFL